MRLKNQYVTSYQTKKNNHHHLEHYLSQISHKINLILEVTHNLKCAAYKMVKLPIDEYRKKIQNDKSSLLTSIDSVFYDLKRVQTILQEKSNNYIIPISHSPKYQFSHDLLQQQFYHKALLRNPSSKSYANNIYQNNVSEPIQNRQLLQRKRSHLGFDRQNSYHDLKRTIKANNAYFQLSSPNHYEKQRILSHDKNINLVNQKRYNQQIYLQTFNNNTPVRNPERLRQMAISNVSSIQYAGNAPQNPMIKISRQRSSNNHIKSPPMSQYNHSPISVNWNDIEKQQFIKDKQNEKFLNEIKRNREQYKSHIKKIRDKCLAAMNKISQQVIPEQIRSNKNALMNVKGRSRTQYFNKSEVMEEEHQQPSISKIKGTTSSLYDGR